MKKAMQVLMVAMLFVVITGGFSTKVAATDTGSVLGTQTTTTPTVTTTTTGTTGTTSFPVNKPTTPTVLGDNTTNQVTDNTNTTPASTGNETTSPLVIICLVAGVALIIAVLLFLVFWNGNKDKEQPKK